MKYCLRYHGTDWDELFCVYGFNWVVSLPSQPNPVSIYIKRRMGKEGWDVNVSDTDGQQ